MYWVGILRCCVIDDHQAFVITYYWLGQTWHVILLCNRFVDCWLLVASATFLEELLGVGHMAMLGRFRRRIAAAALSRWVWKLKHQPITTAGNTCPSTNLTAVCNTRLSNSAVVGAPSSLLHSCM